MNMIAVSRDYLKRNPETVEGSCGPTPRASPFMNHNKERALKIIAKYAHLGDAKQVEDHYRDS